MSQELVELTNDALRETLVDIWEKHHLHLTSDGAGKITLFGQSKTGAAVEIGSVTLHVDADLDKVDSLVETAQQWAQKQR